MSVHVDPPSRGVDSRPQPPTPEEIARLSGELLHDLNDALATLSVQIDLAGMEARDGSASPATVERLRDSFDQLRQMVRDVFEEIVGLGTPPEVEFDPCEVARTSFDQWLPTAPSVHASFDCELPPTARVGGRASLFARAVTNLLRNAARHAHSEIRVRGRTEGTLAEAMLLVTVDDDGPGVPDELREQLFEPFVHGGHGGSGLGLSMVRWAAGRLGGTVELSGVSPLGGARFVLRLPLVRRRSLAASRPRDLPLTTLAGRIVAIVDEGSALAGVYAPMLRREGATALHFSASAGADAAALASLIGSTRPDAILLDLRLASGTGAEILRALQRGAPDLARRVLSFGDATEAPDALPLSTGAPLRRSCPWDEVRSALQEVLTG